MSVYPSNSPSNPEQCSDSIPAVRLNLYHPQPKPIVEKSHVPNHRSALSSFWKSVIILDTYFLPRPLSPPSFTPLRLPFCKRLARTQTQSLMNSFLRFMFGLSRRSHTFQYYNDSKWLQPHYLRQYHPASFICQSIISRLPSYILQLTFKSSAHLHTLSSLLIWLSPEAAALS